MAVTEESFRQHYPEFQSKDRFPDGAITYYITLAGLLLSSARWSTLLDLGTELFIAHNIALERRAQDEAAKGAVPGQTTGPVNAKGVGPVSVGYDTANGIVQGAGHWNLTIYGTRFMELVSMFGAGPIQIGIGSTPPLSTQGAWYGPWPGPW